MPTRSALRASVKDVAENIMIVDLVRNDLGRVARTGSVTVPELLAVRPAPGVWHLVSTVSATVAADLPMASVLDATFPPASVTGTPKARARELLTGWEPHRRGVYCGTVGLASPIAGCELNVAIRTVEFAARRHRGARRGRRHHRRLRPGRVNGRSACTRHVRSSVVPATALDEDLRRSLRLTDHQVVAGVDLDHHLHAA